jgi:ABC-2 type transport system ATP-binding protein
MRLSISNVSKTYPNGVRALDGVSLDIPAGMFGLVGPNGAGKSSLMRTIATLQSADQGTIDLDGIDVLTDKDAVRRRLGYLPQEFGVYPKLTALDLLDHIAVLKGVTVRGERKALVEALLQQTNLYEARHKKLGTFSGGMKQRFGIAIALIGQPTLIIVDEPTAGLDPAERRRFLNLLSAIGRHVIVILSTHIVDDVHELCSQMAIIDRGRVLMRGDPKQAVSALEGRMWTRAVEADDLEGARHRYHVVSTHLVAGRTELRLHAEERPDPACVSTAPTLEDVYFLTLSGAQH